MLIALIVIVVLVLVVLGLAMTKPNNFRYERSVTMNADPSKIAENIDDLHKFCVWSPYEKLDPNMKKTFSGPEKGVGATYEWSGNGKAGVGKMIVNGSSDSKVSMDLIFTKPMACHNQVEFLIEPVSGGTKVTWAMFGENKMLAKVFSVFMNMDKMCGESFEEGLGNLKKVVEA